MPDGLGRYRWLLRTALDAGYHTTSIENHWRRIRADAEAGQSPGPYLVLRHDVDTDPDTARAMWEIELDLNVEASYFFRLSTLEPQLMSAIASGGSSASYHYEELATIAKRLGLRSRDALLRHMPQAREEFASNLDRIRRLTGLPLDVVASHGDFTNRATGVSNTEILADDAFRREVGIELEAYDERFMSEVSSRHADDLGPAYWRPSDPAAAVARGERVIYLLLHPRNWRTNLSVNARDDVRRLWEGIRYAAPRIGRPPPKRSAVGSSFPDAPPHGNAARPATAFVHAGVTLGEGATIGDFVLLGEPPSGARSGERLLVVGRNAHVRSHTVVYAGSTIGDDFQTGHGALIREECRIGNNVSVGSHSVIEHHVTLGDDVRIHSNAFIPEFSVLEEGAWVGPNAVLTNARYPLSPGAKDELVGPRVEAGAKIGANATLLPGVVIGKNALVGAASVVTRDVPQGAVMVGNPARVVGSVADLPAYASRTEAPVETP